MKRLMLAATVLVASMSAQASFDGATVQATYYFPDLDSVFDQRQAVVGPGVEFSNFPASDPRTNVDFSDTNILITYNSASTWTTATFNGGFFDSVTEVAPISDVTINGATNMVGLTSDRVDWTSTSVSINWNGLSFDTSTVVSLDVAFGEAVAGTAFFPVTKTFSDGETGDVEVTLTCNGGIPLQQSFTISSDGPGVTFTVSGLPDAGADCQVTETGGVDGYTPEYNGGSGCAWTGVTGGVYSCDITNSPSLFDFVVDFEWDDTAAEASGSVDVNLYCTNVVNPDGSLDTTTRMSPDNPYTATATTDEEFEWIDVGAANDDEDSDGNPVNPTTCWAMATNIDDSAVEVSGCEPFTVNVGDDEATCTMTASVFFEGIPTLSQYGLAIMALLMLGLGFVGFRRFV
jgi:hypothetical protein